MRKTVMAWIAVLLVCYFFLEVFFFQYVTRFFPVSSLGMVGFGGKIFTQYSKDDVIPKNYIAILGDSYAFGQGDWLLEGQHRVRPPYSPAHILHDTLKRDVVSFGLPASDSVRANVVLPTAFLAAARQSFFEKVDDPDTVIVYFYEGNDINDNVEVANVKIVPKFKSTAVIHDTGFFQQKIIPSILQDDELVKSVSESGIANHLFFFQFCKAIIANFYNVYVLGNGFSPWKNADAGKTTEINLAGTRQFLPDGLQSPALSLDKDEIDLGLAMFWQSLAYTKKMFPHSRIGIAYIPAVITSYDVVSPAIHDYYKSASSGGNIQNSSGIEHNSNYICQGVRDIALQQNLGFVDTRSRLRKVASTQLIHGPIDWHHFNRLGYETLSQDLLLLVSQLESVKPVTLPDCRWQ